MRAGGRRTRRLKKAMHMCLGVSPYVGTWDKKSRSDSVEMCASRFGYRAARPIGFVFYCSVNICGPVAFFFFDRGSIGFLRISHDVSSKGGCKTNRTILRNRYIAYIACIMTE